MEHTVAGSIHGGVGFSNLGGVSGCHDDVAGLVQHTCGSVYIAFIHVSLSVLHCQVFAVFVTTPLLAFPTPSPSQILDRILLLQATSTSIQEAGEEETTYVR